MSGPTLSLTSDPPVPGATVGVVSELMDVEAMETIGQSSEFTSQVDWAIALLASGVANTNTITNTTCSKWMVPSTPAPPFRTHTAFISGLF